ncbi:MAG TPA: ATP-binding protein [Ktedonobacterales bacterium]|nr:ATP-binding protein [Ktedonobacterales bacterium]
MLAYALNWAIRAVSLFNTITLVWLGLTVLLNAERRRWATWIAAGGLLLAGAFFAAHTTIVGYIFARLGAQVSIWWRLIWLPFIFWPYLWYLVIVSYTGVLRAGRHHIWLSIASGLGCMAFVVLLFPHNLPTYEELTDHGPDSLLTLGGIPVLTLIYPAYSVLCFILALSALHQPAGSQRFMGDLAQRRALPWLIGASFGLLLVSLCVGAVVAWLLEGLDAGQISFASPATQTLLTAFDIVISTLIAGAVALAGQGMVAYEIFTRRAMPRGGLARYWHNNLILAGGYSAAVAGSLLLTTNAIYPLVLATLIMTAFYGLLSWRSYAEYERGMERLRPFVASQRLYEHLLKPTMPSEVDIATPFTALCEGVLGTQVAYLAAIGPLAPLGGLVLAYPARASLAPHILSGITARFHAPQQICLPLDAAQYGGAAWAVPLWSERGPTGVLLLGNRRDGRLYTQEEMEIARATGERLIDTQASAEMARRLMSLQRERLAESQIIDQRTRRVLHDDVLARLHTAMLRLSGPQASAPETTAETVTLLGEIHHQIANLLHAMPVTTTREVAHLGLVGALRRVVDTELAADFDSVAWHIAPEAERALQQLSPLAAEVLFSAAREAIRNAARYGRGAEKDRPLHLKLAATWREGLRLAIEDDGVGLGSAQPTASGSGHGLALHSTMMTIIGGTLTAESGPSGGTQVTLALPPEDAYAPPFAGNERRSETFSEPPLPAAQADQARHAAPA